MEPDTVEGSERPDEPQRAKAGLRPRQRFGKYRIVRRLGEGSFAAIYEALDTIEGVRVALRVPRARFVGKDMLETFRNEVRLVARLEHPNILPIKNADFIDGVFATSTLLGKGTLGDELNRRALPVRTALSYAEQILEAVAYAHEQGIIHCDIKPENLILFPGARLRLTDFGIAKVALRTMAASGSGTIGYLAPEQALGRPSLRSDVFSVGLVLYQMLSGAIPEWPFHWPPPGIERVRRKVSPELIALIERALRVDQYRRYADAGQMLAAFRRLKKARKLEARRPEPRRKTATAGADWRALRARVFLRRFKKALDLKHHCPRCGGATSEAMRCCPWCGKERKRFRGETDMPARCPRCGRGRKLDWRSCPWCYGPSFPDASARRYADRRYVARCANPDCTRKLLMPFMRYCPWCRTKVQRNWAVPESKDRCAHCGWGVVPGFWDHCPWCCHRLNGRKGSP